MAESPPARTAIIIPWATLLRVGLALVVAGAAVRLVPALVTAFISVLLAMTLDPLVVWLEKRRVPRPLGATLVTLSLVAVAAGLLWAAVPIAIDQAQVIAQRVTEFGNEITSRLPQPLTQSIHKGVSGRTGLGALASGATRIGASLLRGAATAVLALALMLYLLVDGRRTYAYALAYVPLNRRQRVGETAEEVQRIVSAYVAGNVLTSVLAALFVFVVLTVLKVPAALVLALLAGLFDFLPVVGFILSLAPALLLAFTVSATTALAVTALYAAYHLVEAYYITPKVYGDRLELSDVAVLLAFAFGYEIGGVVGAVLSLPIVAAYPTVERLWLAERLGRHVVREHEEIAETPASEFKERG
jgi:predicted PurR-regulated permease PerM